VETIDVLVQLGIGFLIYFLFTFILILIGANFPRKPVDKTPDWGVIQDKKIKTAKNKEIEAWIVTPNNVDESKPAILLTHGWARNRGRMVDRARYYGKKGYITILISARDHGNSDKERFGMSIVKFSIDIEAIVNWWGKPIILNGHSIGGGASLIVSSRNKLVLGSIIEAPMSSVPGGLIDVYKPIFKQSVYFFALAIILITELIIFWDKRRKDYSPLHSSKYVNTPTLIIHGKFDDVFPYYKSNRFKKTISDCKVQFYDEADHSNLEFQAGYEELVTEFADYINHNRLLK